MNDQKLRAKVQNALDNKLSGVKDNPWLAQRVMNCAEGEEPVMKKKLSLSIVLVIVAVLALGTALAVAVNTDFFSHVFGNETRENVTKHTETFDNGKGGTYSYVYPSREYVAPDPEMAERLIGGQVMNDPVTVQMGDHTLTVLNAVRDENAMVMEMTLECPAGVRGLNYDRLTNEDKGAWFADDAEHIFWVDMAAEMMYVDLKNSTDTCLRIYYYCVFYDPLADGESPVLTVADVTLGPGPEDRVLDPREVVIPADRAAGAVRFAADDGRIVELSPFSLKTSVDFGAVMAEAGAEYGAAEIPVFEEDPGALERIELLPESGEPVVILDETAHLDNTIYLCGGLGESGRDMTMVLNRLVDPAAVKCVRINGTEYLPAE